MGERLHHRLGIELLIFGRELVAFQDVEIVACHAGFFSPRAKLNLGGVDGRAVMIEVDHELRGRALDQESSRSPRRATKKPEQALAIAPPEIRTVGRPMAVNAFETIDAGMSRRAR